jgi:hypothetical protein
MDRYIRNIDGYVLKGHFVNGRDTATTATRR